MIHSTVYDMSNQMEPHNHTKPLYERFQETLEDRFRHLATVLKVAEERGRNEFLAMWCKLFEVGKWLIRAISRPFMYLVSPPPSLFFNFCALFH